MPPCFRELENQQTGATWHQLLTYLGPVFGVQVKLRFDVFVCVVDEQRAATDQILWNTKAAPTSVVLRQS